MTEKRIDEMTLADYRRAFENMECKRCIVGTFRAWMQRPVFAQAVLKPNPHRVKAQQPEPAGFMVINDAGMAAVWEQGWIASSKEAARLTGVRFPRV